MDTTKGRRLALSLPRRQICDLMHFALKVPTIPVQRRMNLAPLMAARKAVNPRPSWAAIFTKAFALISARHAPLRRFYIGFPWAHLYEHAFSVANIAIERSYEGEDAVFGEQIARPETWSISKIDTRLRKVKSCPVENIGSFRRAMFIGRFPWPIRRFLWWVALNCWPRKRAAYLGTFAVTAYGRLGASSLHPLSTATATINWGTIEANGDVDARLIYDHRVMDGSTVARILADLENTLNGEIVKELADWVVWREEDEPVQGRGKKGKFSTEKSEHAEGNQSLVEGR